MIKYSYEWTLTHKTENVNGVFALDTATRLSGNSTVNSFPVRPVVYLKNDILVLNGSEEDAGSINNPYIVSLSS